MKDTKYYQMFADLWRFMGDHYPPENTNAFLDRLIDDADIVARKYNSDFVNKVLVAIMRELERIR